MKKIVVVDDQPVLTRIYKSIFNAGGFHVEVAVDGEQALKVIESSKPDLVLLDLLLPKIGGLEVLKILRSNPAYRSMPIIVFTAAANPRVVEDAWEAGATLVLSKTSTSPKQVLESVQSTLAKHATITDPAGEDSAIEQSGTETVSRRACVLLIENHQETHAIISHLLTHAGYQVVHAEGEAHALLLIEATLVDLILTNRSLCSNSVRSFCKLFESRHPHLPIVMYGITDSLEEIREATEGGASKFVNSADGLLKIAEMLANLIPVTAPAKTV
jgi:CheY-like chemotaxis protein